MKLIAVTVWNNPVLVGAALLAGLDALTSGLEWRQAVIAGAAVALRQVVDPHYRKAV